MQKPFNSEIAELLGFIEREGLDTISPGDVRGHPLFLWALRSRNPFGRGVRLSLNLADRLNPRLLRQILRIPRRRTPGSMAFLALAYTEFESIARGEGWGEKARSLLEELAETGNSDYGGKGWGFPFDWNAFTVVPAGTPIGHTAMTCGNAFLEYFHVTGETWALDEAVAACVFIKTGLREARRSSGSIALSYTPLDDSQVVNTNADNSSLLFRVGSRTNRKDFIELALRLLDFVLETQNEDGSWYYNAPDFFGGKSKIDSYHMGMVIKALSECLQSDPVPEAQHPIIAGAISRGTEFYLKNLFTSEGHPRYTTTKTYPLDSYGYFQALTTLIAVEGNPKLPADLRTQTSAQLGLVREALKTMKAPEGGYYHRRYPGCRISIGSLHFANGPLLYGLAQLFERDLRMSSGDRRAEIEAQGLA